MTPGARAQEQTLPFRPNVIVIMLDDLGKEWLEAYGSSEKLTPNVSRLARTGTRFDNVYSMPVCTPTRVTLLTGQYPWRHGWVDHWDVPRWGVGYFDPSYYPLVARNLWHAGYATAAAGKWQLNDFRIHPTVLADSGFQDYCMWTGVEAGNEDVSQHRYVDPYIHTPDGSRTYAGAFGSDIFTTFLIDFLKRNQGRPQFVYFPMCLPHEPLVPTPLEPEAEGPLERYRAMIRYADAKLGEILDALERLQLRERTVVIWTADNGSPRARAARRNGRLTFGGKGTLAEAGINAPFIASAPGLIPEGRVSKALIDFSDIHPTLAELAGARLLGSWTLDGRSFARHLLGLDADGPRTWILSMDSSVARVVGGRIRPAHAYAPRVLRDKRFKLHVGADGRMEQLFDLHADPAEEQDLLGSDRKAVRRARRRLRAAATSLPRRDRAPKYGRLPVVAGDL